MKVFLGGTCNDSTWREMLIPKLQIEHFNPVVDDWTEECMEEELRQREQCDFVLYVITPEMTGVYSIAEVVDDSNKRPGKTLFLFSSATSEGQFTGGQYKSLKAVAEMVKKNGARIFYTLGEVARFLNAYVPPPKHYVPT